MYGIVESTVEPTFKSGDLLNEVQVFKTGKEKGDLLLQMTA